MILGKIVYKYIFKPTLPFRYNIAHFGIIGWFEMWIGQKQMIKKSKELNTIYFDKINIDLECCYLTGANYWYQTIFCVYSLAKNTQNKIKVNIYTDGTLTKLQKNFILKVFPDVNFIDEETVLKKLAIVLPQEVYPTLWKLRNSNAFFRRIFDIHTTQKWSLHLDSDMLFFKTPQELINSYKNKSSVYMVDKLEQSYFITDKKTLKEKYNVNVMQKLNGGIIAYDSYNVNYLYLENISKKFINDFGIQNSAQIEQTLMSSILYSKNPEALDTNQYSIFYDNNIEKNNQILNHYIFKAKYLYFTKEWKRILN